MKTSDGQFVVQFYIQGALVVDIIRYTHESIETFRYCRAERFEIMFELLLAKDCIDRRQHKRPVRKPFADRMKAMHGTGRGLRHEA